MSGLHNLHREFPLHSKPTPAGLGHLFVPPPRAGTASAGTARRSTLSNEEPDPDRVFDYIEVYDKKKGGTDHSSFWDLLLKVLSRNKRPNNPGGPRGPGWPPPEPPEDDACFMAEIALQEVISKGQAVHEHWNAADDMCRAGIESACAEKADFERQLELLSNVCWELRQTYMSACNTVDPETGFYGDDGRYSCDMMSLRYTREERAPIPPWLEPWTTV